MKTNYASNILKILLLGFAIGALLIGLYVLPIMAGEMAEMYPEIAYAKLPILITAQGLLGLLLIGIGVIMYLLVMFDRGAAFSIKFAKGLNVLVAMCLLASIGVLSIFYYLSSLGGPGPLLGLFMLAIIFVIWIVAAVIILIRAIVVKGITYKNDFDLTV